MKPSVSRASHVSSAMLVHAVVQMAMSGSASAVDLRVSTDFEGGSARVESVDQLARVIRFMPGGDPGRGWPCWWYLRVDGVAKGERLTLDLAGSDLPAQTRARTPASRSRRAGRCPRGRPSRRTM